MARRDDPTLRNVWGPPIFTSVALAFEEKSATLAMSGATATAVGVRPANRLILGVFVENVAAVVGPTSYNVGDGVIPDLWGNGVALTRGAFTTMDNFSQAAGVLQFLQAPGNVVLTAVGGVFSAGSVRVAAVYLSVDLDSRGT